MPKYHSNAFGSLATPLMYNSIGHRISLGFLCACSTVPATGFDPEVDKNVQKIEEVAKNIAELSMFK